MNLNDLFYKIFILLFELILYYQLYSLKSQILKAYLLLMLLFHLLLYTSYLNLLTLY